MTTIMRYTTDQRRGREREWEWEWHRRKKAFITNRWIFSSSFIFLPMQRGKTTNKHKKKNTHQTTERTKKKNQINYTQSDLLFNAKWVFYNASTRKAFNVANGFSLCIIMGLQTKCKATESFYIYFHTAIKSFISK